MSEPKIKAEDLPPPQSFLVLESMRGGAANLLEIMAIYKAISAVLQQMPLHNSPTVLALLTLVIEIAGSVNALSFEEQIKDLHTAIDDLVRVHQSE